MATDLEKIKRTLVGISRGNSILDTLIEFERTLDNVEIFAYKNWISGELVEGPTISRYWYKTVWMFPYNLMPDPDAGLRLTKLGSRVSFKKAIFKRPVKVKGPEDWVDPESKRAKMKETDIWLVTIKLPIKYINRGLDTIDDTIQQDIQKTNADIEMAFDEQEPAGMPTEDVIDGEEEIPLEDEQI
jgi:hypothetical protein